MTEGVLFPGDLTVGGHTPYNKNDSHLRQTRMTVARHTSRNGVPMKVSVLSTTHPMIRDISLLTLGAMVDTLSIDLNSTSTILTYAKDFQIHWSRTIPLAHSCISCSIREAIAPALNELRIRGTKRLLLALPVAIEPLHAAPGLVDLTTRGYPLYGCTITSVVHALDQDSAAADLVRHIPLSDQGIAYGEDDTRCTGEVLMSCLGYADAVMTLGNDPLGSDLVEHLRPFDTLRIDSLDDLTEDLLFESVHDPDEAIARIHPTSTRAWGGPTAHGVWTLDLNSDRPFHPERLRAFAGELAATDSCARGCFWLPSRPRDICTWEVSGGSVSVGTAGHWKGDPFTHIIATGVGPSQERIHRAFGQILMTEAEMRDCLAWVGAADGLEDWFPMG